MRPALLSRLALLALVASVPVLAGGCSDEAAATSGASSSGSGGAASSGAGGATGGSTGGEPLPDLDPAACPITAESGEDPVIAEAAEAAFDPAWVFPSSASTQQDKAFPFATALAADGALLGEVLADPELTAASADRDARLRAAPEDCADDAGCLSAALAWSGEEAAAAGAALAARLGAIGQLAPFAEGLRASGRFGLHATLDDAGLVTAAFGDLTVALGVTLSAEVESLGGAGVRAAIEAVAAEHPAPLAFFEPLLLVDLAALIADERDEAARYEPLAEGENAAAAAHVASVDWDQYPFTIIVVPGKGPNDLDTPLDPAGKLRADLAAQRYEAGLAPFIALSGGHVHPDRTPYSEALQMKAYLMEERSIPEEALFVDPHARHTTTNLRNVSRLLYRHQIPTDRPLLVTSDVGQSLYIGFWHGTFGPRCIDELGYLPWRSLVPISSYDACMVPVAVSLHADGRDALDP